MNPPTPAKSKPPVSAAEKMRAGLSALPPLVMPWLIVLLYVGGYTYYYNFLRSHMPPAFDLFVAFVWVVGFSTFARIELTSPRPASPLDFGASLTWRHVLTHDDDDVVEPLDASAEEAAKADIDHGRAAGKRRAIMWTLSMSSRNPSAPSFSFVSSESDEDRPRMCEHCNAPKPDRAYHSQVERRCLLKFDHYCIFLNKTVAHHNYKLFIIFLLYTALISAMASLVTASMPDAPYRIFFSVLMAAVCSLVLMLLATNVYHIFYGTTTIEQIKFEEVLDVYDYGWWLNFQSVFGRSGRWYTWLLPVRSTPGVGLCWPPREDLERYWDWCDEQRRSGGADGTDLVL